MSRTATPKQKKNTPAVEVNTPQKHRVSAVNEFSGRGGTIQSFNVDALRLPPTKGPNALSLYQSLAKGGGLQAILKVNDVRTKAALWQERANTSELRARWLQRIGWPDSDVTDQLWQKAGGGPAFPTLNGETLQMDHIVELQVGGNNTIENIQILEPGNNRDSGSAIKNQVFGLAEEILQTETLSDGDADEIQLSFSAAVMSEAPVQSKALLVEQKAKTIKPPKGSMTAQVTEPYPIRAGGATTDVQAPPAFAKDSKAAPVPILNDAANKPAAELVPGLLLETLRHNKSADEIGARIDDRNKTRLPVTLNEKRGDDLVLAVNKTTRVLKQTSAAKEISFTYPYLSPGAITSLRSDPDGGLSFAGYIETKIPFLGRLDVEYSRDEFRLVKDLSQTLKSPLPGTRITEAKLALTLSPELKPSGYFAFAIGPQNREFLEARVEVSRNESGLVATGTIHAFIPGVDKAGGNITYSNGNWSGQATLQADQLKSKLKYVRSGQITVAFDQGQISPSGEIVFDLPRTDGITAKVSKQNDRWVFDGDGTIKIPRLGDLGMHVTYDGKSFVSRIRPGPTFTLLNVQGQLEELTYRDGAVRGKGSLTYKRGKASGKLALELNEDGRFTGSGELVYQVNDNLAVTGTAALDKDEKLQVKGKLTYNRAIEIPHTKFGGEKALFDAGITIPIPGLSLGPAVGLKARIEGSLSAGFSIGPAQIRKIEIGAAFNPLEPNTNIEITGAAEFFMPASAHVAGAIRAGIMLDAFIGDITGGLEVRARADLDGSFTAPVNVSCTPKRFSLDAQFELMLNLALLLGIDAWLRARAGIAPFDVETEKRWTLAERKIDSGLKFGVRAPIHYASDEAFIPPSWDSIEFIKPTIDFSKLLDRAISSAQPIQKAGG
ncbi:MAG TPA: hypothetical protein VM008_07135 [Phycisphaerae bacterium]|nr:hypothetical protein [Phycisphaerae bacterium]